MSSRPRQLFWCNYSRATRALPRGLVAVTLFTAPPFGECRRQAKTGFSSSVRGWRQGGPSAAGTSSPDTIERNRCGLSEQERQQMGLDHLPESLGQAIEETAGSELVETALGSHIFARYVDLKREECL
jgi:hypothetical protein